MLIWNFWEMEMFLLVNLIDNAIEASRKGEGAEISLETILFG